MLADDEYRHIYRQVPRLCVSTIVLSDAGLALIRRNIEPELGRWHLPGGRVFKGETVVQAAARVVMRELGTIVEFAGDPCAGYIEARAEKYDADFNIHNVDIVLLGYAVNTTLTPASGEGEAAWFVAAAPPRTEWHSRHIQFLIGKGYLHA